MNLNDIFHDMYSKNLLEYLDIRNIWPMFATTKLKYSI